MSKKREKKKDLKKQRDLLYLFYSQIAMICTQQVAMRIQSDSDQNKEVSDLFMNFSVHTFANFFSDYFHARYKPKDLDSIPEGIVEEYKKGLEEEYLPAYKKELQKITDKYKKNKESNGSHSYFQ